EVGAGEVFGFLGPNGAGKTTTIKILMGLIRPTEGRVTLFDQPVTDPRVRSRIGFLPEQPYFHDYLKPAELLRFMGGLQGLSGAALRREVDELLELVGLGHARDRTLRKFSKGMLQRVGIAQAFLGDPDLVILDEPFSGLDPIGRKEMKDVLERARARGRTLFFSSHILSDVELLCDRVAILDRGRLVRLGATRDLVAEGTPEVEIAAATDREDLAEALGGLARVLHRAGRDVRLMAPAAKGPQTVARLVELGAEVRAVLPRTATLEDVFVRAASPREGRAP
ncbi:MAG: ABC transporter ATP-binding protein, partial [Deltaproteobacteria bacterium]|nr:ABC transporter ATP-binding protein [Deltaproteobacteria bacterium]